MSAPTLATTTLLAADTEITVVGFPFLYGGAYADAVRVGPIGNDLRIVGTADDLDRLANALHEAAASIRETT